jgi:hypothetical protein
MHLIEPLGILLGQPDHLQGQDQKSFGFQPGQNLSRKIPLHGIRLNDG